MNAASSADFARGATEACRLASTWLTHGCYRAAGTPDATMHVVARNRLGPILGMTLDWDRADPSWVAQRDACTAAYGRNVLAGRRQLDEAKRICGALGSRAIPAVHVRGAAYGARLYGDVGLRHSGDMDIFVPPAQTAAAWDVMRGLGYALRAQGLSRQATRRHHLAWSLYHPASGHICDLHWAVDHAYRPYRIGYEALFAAARCEPDTGARGFRIEMEIVLSALHAVKELRVTESMTGLLVLGRAARQGQLRCLMDTALLMRSADSRQMNDVRRMARAWCVERLFSVIVDAIDRLAHFAEAPVELPAENPVATAALVRMGVRLGFRGERLTDIGAWCWPVPDYFADAKGAALAVARGRHLLRAGGDICRMVYDGAVALRSGERRTRNGVLSTAGSGVSP